MNPIRSAKDSSSVSTVQETSPTVVCVGPEGLIEEISPSLAVLDEDRLGKSLPLTFPSAFLPAPPCLVQSNDAAIGAMSRSASTQGGAQIFAGNTANLFAPSANSSSGRFRVLDHRLPIDLRAAAIDLGPGAFREVGETSHIARADVERSRFLINESHNAQNDASFVQRVQSDILANVSHEIRTPMTAILGYLEAFLEENQGREASSKTNGLVACVQQAARRLMEVLGNILELASLESGTTQSHQAPTHLSKFISELVAEFAPQASEKGIQFRVEWKSPVPKQITFDRDLAHKVVQYLLDNAVKFTGFGEIVLGITWSQAPLSGSALVLTVEDTGSGMTPDVLQNACDPFVQGDASPSRAVGGTGLGLALARRSLAKLGGTMTISSTPDLGTKISISLPVTDPVWQGTLHVSTSDSPAPAKADRPNDSNSAPLLAGVRVLLADDCVDNHRIIAHLLRKAGAQVAVAENGEEAIQRLTVDGTTDGSWISPPAFDVILMDMQMPVMNGYQAARLLRDRGNTIPVVAVTAHTVSGERDRCLEAGCVDFCTKPIQRKQLVDMVAFHAAR